MKFVALLAASAAATAAATEMTYVGEQSNKMTYVGEGALRGSASGMVVKHGVLGDDKHCEELQIPSSVYDKFWSTDGHLYSSYTDGLCPVPYTTYDKTTNDDHYPTVQHVTRGIGATDGSISVTSCGGDLTWSAGPVVKGSKVTITGTGSLSSTTSGGSYTVSATYGTSISLVDATSSLAKAMSQDIKVLLTDFGTLTVQPFALPASGNVKVVIEVPVPNIGGTVNGKSIANNQMTSPVWCLDMKMTL